MAARHIAPRFSYEATGRDAADAARSWKVQSLHRFHFHVQDGRLRPDQDGVLLPSMEEARLYAIRLSADILSRNEQAFSDGTEWQITVTDETGEPRFTLSFFGQAV